LAETALPNAIGGPVDLPKIDPAEGRRGIRTGYRQR
jgi:hypothetical protein